MCFCCFNRTEEGKEERRNVLLNKYSHTLRLRMTEKLNLENRKDDERVMTHAECERVRQPCSVNHGNRFPNVIYMCYH